jgi:uncharacterized protein involved in exopolysaccharide biosynthesis/MinD-like ATPase involved in chromosome partitioning or flagellar assembly
MSQTVDAADFQVADYARVLRRRWWIVLLVTILGVAVSVAYYKLAHKEYTATASVYVTATSTTASQVANGRTTGTVNLDTEAQVVQSTTVAGAAAKLMHSTENVAQIISRVKVTVPPNSQVLSISCQGSSPAIAATCAESFAKAYLSYSSSSTSTAVNNQLSALQSKISSLESDSAKLTSEIAILPANSTQRAADQEQLNSDHNELGELNGQVAQLTTELADPSGGSIISDATLPQQATSPKATLVLPSGLLGGLIIGLIIAFFVDRRDRRIRGPREVTALDVPVLASFPRRRPAPATTIAATRSREGRGFAELAHVLTGSRERGRHVILITSVAAGRGASYVAANLAVALARNQPGVTLVCADLEGSTIPSLLDLSVGPGLTDVLAGSLSVDEAGRHPAAAPRLRVITPGGAAGSRADDLAQDAVERLSTELGGDGYVVVEAPPVPSGPDVYTLAHVADTAVMIVEVPRTRTDQVLNAVQHLGQMGASVAGAVLVPLSAAADVRAPKAAEPGPSRPPKPGVPSAVAAARAGHQDFGAGDVPGENATEDWSAADVTAAAARDWSAAEETSSSLPGN